MSLEKIALAMLAATVTLNLSACGVGEAKIASPEVEDAATPLPVEVSSPVTADISATYHTTATITADAEAVVLARVGGEVEEIFVEENDHVHAGQVLARLDGDRLRLRMQQAKAKLDKVRKEYERFVRLQEKGLVSASAIESLKFDMDALEAVYELQRLDYRYTFIRAPISGIVSARVVKVGQHVDVNDATFRITDKSKLVATLRIPQTELEKFSVGHLAKLRVDAMPELPFYARIVRISPTIDVRNGTFRATAYIDNEDGLLAPGMFGRFDIAYEQHAENRCANKRAPATQYWTQLSSAVAGGLAFATILTLLLTPSLLMIQANLAQRLVKRRSRIKAATSLRGSRQADDKIAGSDFGRT